MAFNTAHLPEGVTSLIEKATAQAANLKLGNSKMRKELLITTRSLYLALETPMEAVLRIGWAEVSFSPKYFVSDSRPNFKFLSTAGFDCSPKPLH
jgi:hypothetical protein